MAFDPKKPFRQRNGSKAWLIADLREQGFPEAVEEPLIVGINTVDGRAYWAAYDADGVYRRSYNSGSDLINIPKKSCNICRYGGAVSTGEFYCAWEPVGDGIPPWMKKLNSVRFSCVDHAPNCPCYEERAE